MSAEKGLYRMILESRIHSTEVMAQSTTPPHPKSRLHEVRKMRAPSSGLAIMATPPGRATIPSTVPS